MARDQEQSAAIGAVAALDDRLRSRMYAFIRASHQPVTREETAAELGISRKLAAFHLDKLVSAGLLRAGVAADGPRRVGRAPKTYEPVQDAMQVSIPERSPHRLASILVGAITTATPGESAPDARKRVAAQSGRELGEAADREHRGGRLGPERALSRVESALAGLGFEPYRPGADRLRLRNCPFHPLAAEAPELVCGINEAYLRGLLEGLRGDALEAFLAPRPGECCVEIRRRGATGP